MRNVPGVALPQAFNTSRKTKRTELPVHRKKDRTLLLVVRRHSGASTPVPVWNKRLGHLFVCLLCMNNSARCLCCTGNKNYNASTSLRLRPGGVLALASAFFLSRFIRVSFLSLGENNEKCVRNFKAECLFLDSSTNIFCKVEKIKKKCFVRIPSRLLHS